MGRGRRDLRIRLCAWSGSHSASARRGIWRACRAAEACFEDYAATTGQQRVAFLNAIANEIEKRAEAITDGTQETGLPLLG